MFFKEIWKIDREHLRVLIAIIIIIIIIIGDVDYVDYDSVVSFV